MEDIASRIVDKAVSLGCQDAVADVIENRSYQIRFARNEAVISNQWRESSASVFLVHDRRVVATDIKDLTKADEAVERLVKTAKASQPNPEYAGIAKGPFRYARTRPDPKVLSLDEGGKYVEAAVGGAVDQGAKECAGSFWKYEDEHFLATSNGVEGHDHRASLYLSIRALVSLESSGHGIACATKLSQFTPEKAGQKAGHIASLARAPKAGKAGRYTVLFDPLIFGSPTDQVGGPLAGRDLLRGQGRALVDEHLVHAVPVLRDGRPLHDSPGRDLPHPQRRGRGGVEGHPADRQSPAPDEEHRRAGRRTGADDVVGRGVRPELRALRPHQGRGHHEVRRVSGPRSRGPRRGPRSRRRLDRAST